MAGYTTRQLNIGIATTSIVATFLTGVAATLGRAAEDTIAAAFTGLMPVNIPSPEQALTTADAGGTSIMFLIAGLWLFNIFVVFPLGHFLVVLLKLRVARNPRRFAIAGGGAALLISLAGTAFHSGMGGSQPIDVEEIITLSRLGGIVEIGGKFTPYGWWVEGYLTVRFVLIGALSAVIGRQIVGLPKGVA